MFNYLTPIIYWTLIAIWTAILWICIQRLSLRDFKDSFFTTALIVLSIDALRTLLESLFFGLSHSSALGLLPKAIYDFLGHPGLIFIPKAFNLLGAIVIALLLRTKLLPQEEEEQTATIQRIRELEGQVKEHQQTEKALRESENRLRNIIDATPIGMHMYEVNADGELIFSGSNPAADSILGIDHQKLIGKTILDAFPALEFTETPDRYRDACILGRSWQTEDIRYENSTISKAFEIHAYQTRPGCMVAQFVDITQRKRTEETQNTLNRNLEKLAEERTHDLQLKAVELEEASAQQAEVGRLKSALLNTVSHELKTPLTSIIGYTKLTDRDFTRDFQPLVSGNVALSRRSDRIKNNLSVIGLESARLLGLIDNFLALSRIRSHSGSGEKQATAPADIITRSVDLSVSNFAAQPDIVLDTLIEDNLPDICCDANNLVQMVLNLLDNAAKFAGSGTVRLHCGLTNAGNVHISVSDNGPGIPEQERDKVFEPFHQVCEDEECTIKPPGAGTGLTICKHIAENHEGSITLTCPNSGGCVFTVELPVDNNDESG